MAIEAHSSEPEVVPDDKAATATETKSVAACITVLASILRKGEAAK